MAIPVLRVWYMYYNNDVIIWIDHIIAIAANAVIM